MHTHHLPGDPTIMNETEEILALRQAQREAELRQAYRDIITRTLLSGLVTFLTQRFMHRYVFPRHSWLLFPFNGLYNRKLAEHNASRMIPSAFFGVVRPRYITKEV